MRVPLSTILFLILASDLMAYDIIISRGERYSETFKSISISEWRSIIIKHPELKEQNYAVAINPNTNEEIRIETPGSAVFSFKKKKLFKTIISETYLVYNEKGYLSFKYTTDNETDALRVVAKWLNAELYGEEGDSI